MRGCDEMQESLFTVAKLEDFVPADHPLRPLRELVNEALKRLNGLFNLIYADTGRASIAPEKLMRALLLQAFYSVRAERMLMEQMRYNLLFRGFVGLAIEDAVWDHSMFSKNRDRLLEHQVVCGSVLHRSHEPGGQAGLAVESPFLGGRHPDSGVVQSQELPPQRRPGRWSAGRRWPQRRH